MPSKWQTKLTSYIHESMKFWFKEKNRILMDPPFMFFTDPPATTNGLSNHGSASMPPTGPYRQTLIGTNAVNMTWAQVEPREV